VLPITTTHTTLVAPGRLQMRVSTSQLSIAKQDLLAVILIKAEQVLAALVRLVVDQEEMQTSILQELD
jgi:hypothetical protein